MATISRRAYAFAVLALAVVLFFGVNIFADSFLTDARLDLTQNGQFTLAQGTRNIIAKIPEPITLKFYYSKKVAAQYSTTASYAKEVRDLLAEYAALSHGKIVLEDVDPEPFTPEEDDATAAGMTGAQTDSGDTIYFGLAGSNSIDGRQTIAYFAPEREPYLEYDITSLIYRLSTPETPTLGIISSLPLEGNPQANQPPLAVYSELSQDYKTVDLGTDFKDVPPGVGVLFIAHPVGLSEDAYAAIDQFVLGGGRALVLVDPVSELANRSSPDGMTQSPPSDLGPLLKSWGVAYDPAKVVADKALAQEVRTSASTTLAYPIWLHLTADNFDPRDLVTANLQTLNLASTGALAPIKGATTVFTPLVQTSDQATLVTRDQASISLGDPTGLLASIQGADHRYTIAARIAGTAASAYPDRPSVRPRGPIAVMVIADSDILDDRFWVRQDNELGRAVTEPFADNGALVLNAVENLSGSQDLISLRTRVPAQRPFIVVQQLQAAAQNQFQETAKTLQDRLTATQQQLQQLQQGGATAQANGSVQLTPEQQADIRRFQRELIDTRAQIREVQHNLRKDIDALGSWLAFINIALMPILIAGFAIALGLVRRRRLGGAS